MSQEKIWDYFQNEGMSSFDQALPRYRYISKRIANTMPNSHVLNIGVGSGGLELALINKKVRVSSLDPSASAIDRLKTLGVDGHVGVIQELPFEDAKFDCVVASEVLEHLKEEVLLQALAEVSRVLKPNGAFIGTVPFNENLEDNITVCPCCGARFHRWGHEQSFNEDRLNSFLGREFSSCHISRRTFVPWGLHPLRIVKSAIKLLMARLGEAIANPHLYFECNK